MIHSSTQRPIESKKKRRRKEVKERMRALWCVCGEHLRAENDLELSEHAREHVGRDHPELRLGYERLRAIVANVAYDEP